MSILKMIQSGRDVGVLSEAGAPGIADPGSELAWVAHQRGIEVKPLVGPSSILLAAMSADWASDSTTVVRVDGGMSASDLAMQWLADIINAPVDRPRIMETTALGAAWLAGHKAGVWPDAEGFAAQWALETRFVPSIDADLRARKIAGWHDAVRRTLTQVR